MASGIISKVGGSPVTEYGEEQRSNSSGILSGPSMHEQVRQVDGIVDSVHPDMARWVTAHEPSGKMIYGGQAIELTHSAREIAEKYGTVPIGTTIKVTIYGPGDGVSASATIVDTEGKGPDEPYYSNEAEQGLYAVFAPGIGTG